MRRFIFECDPENLILATRAAKWLLNQPETQKNAVLAYGETDAVYFFVKRNRASISSRQEPKQ